jgi:hypothetical protein
MLHRIFYRLNANFLKRHDRRKIASKILWQAEFDYAIRHAQLVNSRSILFGCDIHPEEPKSSVQNISYLDQIESLLAEFQKNNPLAKPSIYVPSDGLSYFARHVLPKIDISFVLVTGDSDLPINPVTLGTCLEALLSNQLLLAWYAQNRDVNHPKLYSLPIGINLHNLWSNPLEWGGGFILPTLQELQIQTIANQALPLTKRQPKIFCNWHFSIDRADRRTCYEQIDRSLCYFQEKPLPMANTWSLQAQYQFVLSPHGAGFDCHRTWEALMLGFIPIVKKAKLNDLFTDLPVIEVSDWGEINLDFLEKSVEKIQEKLIRLEKLSMHYWNNVITTAKNKL